MTPVESVHDGLLIILGGLPGVGKTEIARKLAKKIKAFHLRIDTIEASIRRSFSIKGDMNDSGYCVSYELSKDNLSLGLTVIADSVNPIEITREAWRNVAIQVQKKFIEIEIICSDIEEHKRRVTQRKSDIVDLQLPTWIDVQERDYTPWKTKALCVDTSVKTADECADAIIETIHRSRICKKA